MAAGDQLTYTIMCISAGKLYCAIMFSFRVFFIFFVIPIRTKPIYKPIIQQIDLWGEKKSDPRAFYKSDPLGFVTDILNDDPRNNFACTQLVLMQHVNEYLPAKTG